MDKLRILHILFIAHNDSLNLLASKAPLSLLSLLYLSLLENTSSGLLNLKVSLFLSCSFSLLYLSLELFALSASTSPSALVLCSPLHTVLIFVTDSNFCTITICVQALYLVSSLLDQYPWISPFFYSVCPYHLLSLYVYLCIGI